MKSTPGARARRQRAPGDQRDRGHHGAQARRAGPALPRRGRPRAGRLARLPGDAGGGRPARGARHRGLVRGRRARRRRAQARRHRPRRPAQGRRGARDRRALPARSRRRRPGSTRVLRSGRSEVWAEITDEMLAARGARRGPPGAAALDRHDLGDGRADARARHGGRRDHVRERRDRPRVRRRRPRRSPRASPRARRPRSRTRACTPRARRSRARCRRRCCRPALPEVPGFELAALYHSASEGTEVGGDFYDVFNTAEDQWYAVVGDVCGKGAEAAAVTAMARYTIRAAAVRRRSPAAILRLLSEAMLRQESPDLVGRFCTIACLHLDLSRTPARATVACGGHPLPALLRADGTVEELGTPGTLIGLVERPELHDRTGELHAGDTIVLYTDGLTEAGRAGPDLGRRGPGARCCTAPPAARRSRSSTMRCARRSGSSPRRATTSRSSRCARSAADQPAERGLPVAVPSSPRPASSGVSFCSSRPDVGALVAGDLVGLLLGVALFGLLGAALHVRSCARGSRPLRPCGRRAPGRGPAPPWPRPCAPPGGPGGAARRRLSRSPAAFLTRPEILSVMPMVVPPFVGVSRGPTRPRRPGKRSAGVLGDRAQPLERAPDQARDVHLGDADALGDLGLREVLDEAQVQHDPVARGQRLQRRGDRGAVLDELEAVVLERRSTPRRSRRRPRRRSGRTRARRRRRPTRPPSPRAPAPS